MANIKHSRRQIAFLIAAGLVGDVSVAKGQDIDSTEKHFKRFAELAILAIKACPILPGPRPSYPVPIFHQSEIIIAFMFCPQRLIRGPVRIRPPNKMAWINPVNGSLIALTNVSPTDFGQTDAIDKYLPEWSFDSLNMTYDAFTSLKNHLFELYDTLFPAWVGDVLMSEKSKLKNRAHEFLDVFYKISEPPLRPYYEALGHDWFGWLRTLAQ